MHIRPACPIDAQAITSLMLESVQEFLVPEYSASCAATFLATIRPEAVVNNMQAGFRYFLCCEDLASEDLACKDERLMGYIAMRERTHIFNLFVAKPFHRQGVARFLWEQARDEMVSEAEITAFTVNASTYSIPVYQQFGFEIIGEKETRNGVVSTPMELRLESGSGEEHNSKTPHSIHSK